MESNYYIVSFFHKVGDNVQLGENEFLLFNPDTGEIKGIFDSETQTIRSKAQIEYYDKHKFEINSDKVYDFGQSGKFNMFSTFSIEQLANEGLTGTDYRVLLLLMSGVGYKTGYISMGNNHSMKPEWIAEKLDVHKKTVDIILKKLIDKGIIAIVITEKKKSYFMNPYIQYKGRWISKDLYNMFKDTKWALKAKDEREKETKNRETMEINKLKRHIEK